MYCDVRYVDSKLHVMDAGSGVGTDSDANAVDSDAEEDEMDHDHDKYLGETMGGEAMPKILSIILYL